MNTADKLTASRIILAPVFFAVYFAGRLLPGLIGWTVPVLWLLFFGIEITDMLDGRAARKQGLVSPFGKLFDPFADTLAWITFLFCFVLDGILPGIVLLVIFYREFGILFLRNLMMRKGVTQGARMGGKIKAIAYMVTGIVSLAVVTLDRLNLADESVYRLLRNIATGVFCLAMVIALVSFTDYWIIYRKLGKDKEKK
jgi:CDP-diacylglycerol--glycerol-3-phosphate 3-phosphatidyltransferase